MGRGYILARGATQPDAVSSDLVGLGISCPGLTRGLVSWLPSRLLKPTSRGVQIVRVRLRGWFIALLLEPPKSFGGFGFVSVGGHLKNYRFTSVGPAGVCGLLAVIAIIRP